MFEVWYLCRYRPLWFQHEAGEFDSLEEAIAQAMLLQRSSGRPTRVQDQAGVIIWPRS